MKYYSQKAFKEYFGNIGINGHLFIDDLDAGKVPSIEIPEPHGELKDTDAMMKDIKDRYCNKESCPDNYGGLRCRACATDDMLSEIDSAPTILEASEVKE